MQLFIQWRRRALAHNSGGGGRMRTRAAAAQSRRPRRTHTHTRLTRRMIRRSLFCDTRRTCKTGFALAWVRKEGAIAPFVPSHLLKSKHARVTRALDEFVLNILNINFHAEACHSAFTHARTHAEGARSECSSIAVPPRGAGAATTTR